mmetsp:Transcript_31905/g.42130  ORF Transcript_31905/g.42130 Transcript_31905/m.42130 type:complete len:384 (+) Transcript_31905:110-1261(+)|eukprot:CAMPEP_0117764016 /NCGR_PEP_ID=MMETSP0947-20121206/19094_1 /TAXON_ID=44440 /ORGANISM="Chattonella subsalsa, Strain CCMP2191" /LENGTH=383 /DNA_ID=CAMNT_0005586057 /DNA_START=44 /DNA_END=1195 /DNA_ORIENTATION=+
MEISEAWQMLLGTFIVFVGLFIFCIPFLIGYSVDVITPTRVGFDFNKKYQTINYDKLYSDGRFWLGLGHRFLTFDTLIKTVKFNWDYVEGDGSYDDSSISGRTHDGLTVAVNMDFQYRLLPDKEHLKGLYETYGYDYEPVYISIARSISRDIFSEYTAFDLITYRDRLSQDIQQRMNETFYNEKYAEVTHLQVLNIDLPDAVKAIIMDTVVAQQDVKQAVHEKNIAIIEAETSVQEAEILKKEILLIANSTVVSTLYAAEREAERILIQRTAEAEAFGQVLCRFQALYSSRNSTDAPTLAPTMAPTNAMNSTVSPTPFFNGTLNSTEAPNYNTFDDSGPPCAFDPNSNFSSTDLLSYIWVQNLKQSTDSATIALEKPSMLSAD